MEPDRDPAAAAISRLVPKRPAKEAALISKMRATIGAVKFSVPPSAKAETR
jgi:hypothetical protein